MQFKTLLLTAVVAAGTASAANPACLLAAVNEQPNPGDIKAVCNKASDVQKRILAVCSGSDQNTALSAFADSCKAAGVTVPTVTPSSAATGSSSGSSPTGSSGTGTASSSSASGASSKSAAAGTMVPHVANGITAMLGVVVASFVGGAMLL